MKKKAVILLEIFGLIIAIAVFIVLSQSSKWSQRSFDAVLEEACILPDGETRFIVCRTTEIYGSPMNSLRISEDTRLLDDTGKKISAAGFRKGDAVRVTLKDAFTEETPYYYPTVYEIRLSAAE